VKWRHGTALATVLLLGTTARAEVLDVKKYDFNHNGVLDPNEAIIYELHRNDPPLAKYDKNFNGKIDPDEALQIARDSSNSLASRRAKIVDSAAFLQNKPVLGVEKFTSKPEADPCRDGPQRLFIRRDRLDTFQYTDERFARGIISRADAKGASISMTRDHVEKSDALTINGRGTFIMARLDPLDKCSVPDASVGDPFAPLDFAAATTFGYILAPWIEGHGTLTEPRKKSERSNLQIGFDAQLALAGGPLFDLQYLVATPYYQTDFRGQANVFGVRAAWEPYALDYHLGDRKDPTNPYLDWFWQLRAEADVRSVRDPGVSGLSQGRYAWLGGTSRLHLNFFPDRSKIEPFEEAPFPALVKRVYAKATFQYFLNVDDRSATTTYTPRMVRLFTTELGYNLTRDGMASVSLQYTRGTDKDTLEKANKYVLGLNFKY
jgi:hypothetical protein